MFKFSLSFRIKFARMSPRYLLFAPLILAGCMSGPDRYSYQGVQPRPVGGEAMVRGAGPSRAAAFQSWSSQAPAYRLYPGDEVEVRVPSAPELSQTVTVAPDGNVRFPLAGTIPATDRTLGEFESLMAQALSSQLLRPQVQAIPASFGSQRVLVLGEVGQPGLYDLPGPIGALEAVAIAGGFEDTANRSEVGIIRRAPDGGAMLRAVDLKASLRGIEGGDSIPLQRFDIVYVPKSGIADANLFVQQYIRDLLPFNLGFSYAAGSAYN